MYLTLEHKRKIILFSLITLITYHILISFSHIHIYENSYRYKFLITNNYLKISYIVFITSPLIFMALIYNIYCIYDNEYYNRMYNAMILDNMLKRAKKVVIPHHLKTICINYLLKEYDICPICLTNMKENEIYLTICGHIFHNECIQECLNYDNKCPSCRTIIEENYTEQ